MKKLIKSILYIGCVALLGLCLVYLIDVQLNAASVLGSVVGAVVAFLISLWFRRWKSSDVLNRAGNDIIEHRKALRLEVAAFFIVTVGALAALIAGLAIYKILPPVLVEPARTITLLAYVAAFCVKVVEARILRNLLKV
ncbi:hypothetical protein [Pseudomonas fragariae (ex Marin et al. 2024)]|uniref:hypothetical protein n=1 Tax=Pseudomonas fragariae (ex Marin et al. 2024) TaxID=3080056 RepID=UPI003F7AA17C